MQGKDSISFGSIRQSSVWHNQDPPLPGHNLSVTFQQIPATSRSYLEGSMIRKIPAQKTSQDINKFMQKNLDVVCLLQAAEIRRLVGNLQEHQIKFKQLQSQPLDRQSYEIQIRELAETSHSLQLTNEQMKAKMEKLKQFVVKQNVEIQKLTAELKRRQNLNKDLTAYRQELQITRSKYEKSIESLNKLFDDNENLTQLSVELGDENVQLKQEMQVLKEHVVQMQERKEAFEEERIREIQRMRESYETKLFETTTEFSKQHEVMTKKVETQFAQEKQKYLEQFNRFKHQLQDTEKKLKLTENRVISLNEENKKLIDQQKSTLKQLSQEREKNNEERTDFNQKFKLFGDEIQRLNNVLGQKENRLKAVISQVQRSRESLIQISKEKEHLIKLLNNCKQEILKLGQLKDEEHLGLLQTRKHLDHYLQKENGYQVTIQGQRKQIEELTRECEEIRQGLHHYRSQIQVKQREQNHSLKEQIISLKDSIQKLKEQQTRQIMNLNHTHEQESKSYKQTIFAYQSKVSQIMESSSQTSMAKEMVIRNYEEKIREYFEQMNQVRQDYDKLKLEYEVVVKENIQVKKQISQGVTQINSENKKQLQQLRQRCKELTKINSLVETKLKSLERQKHLIQKELQQQILTFMQNNHKTETMLVEHNHSVEMINYQQQYNRNHAMLLSEIEKLSRGMLQKQEEVEQGQKVITNLKDEIKRLVQVVEKLEEEIRESQKVIVGEIGVSNQELKGISGNVQKLSLQKELNLQNHQLHRRLKQAEQNLSQFQLMTQKSIDLTQENVRLKHQLQKTTSQLNIYKSNISTLEQSLHLIKTQYTQLLQEKQQLIQTLTLRATSQNHSQRNRQTQDQQSLTNKNIENLLEQFKHLNESLMTKLTQLEQREQLTVQQLIQSVKSHEQNLYQFASSKKLVETQTHIFPQNISQVHMSFNPSKFLQTTKIPEESNQSAREFIAQLKEEIQQMEKRLIEAQEENAVYKMKLKTLSEQNHFYEEKIRKMELDRENLSLKLHEISSLSEINSKVMQENRALVDENQVLAQKLHAKESIVMKITSAHNEMQTQLKTLTRKYTELLSINQDHQKFIQQYHQLKKQLSQKQTVIQQYTEKFASLQQHTDRFSSSLQILQKENHEISLRLQLLQRQNHVLTQQLSKHREKQLLLQSHASTLQKTNYDYALQIEKSKITSGKIDVLNQELQRLEKENLDLIEELDICKFEICSDVSLERRNQELLTILVMSFVEIQSLRSRVKEKQVELTTMRKSNLNGTYQRHS